MRNTFGKIYGTFERAIVVGLLALMMLVLLFSTVHFAFLIGKAIIFNPLSLGPDDDIFILHKVFAGFLLILIGIELMQTIKMYLDDQAIHVEVVLSVSLIAISRHVISLNLHETTAAQLAGLAAVIGALTLAYFFYRRAIALPVSHNKTER